MQAVRSAPRRRGSLENDHQVALFQWAGVYRLGTYDGLVEAGAVLADYLFHIPNGGKRTKAEAGIFKAMGTKAGISDLFLPIPVSCKGGLWIEMKAPYTNSKNKNYPSKEQRKWLARMEKAGYAAAVCYGWLEAKKVITEYLEGAA